MATEVKTLDDLNGALKEIDETMAGVQEKITAQIEEAKTGVATKEEFEEFKATIATFEDKIKGVTILAKAAGSFKETKNPESIALEGGKYIQALMEARHGSKVARSRLGEYGIKEIKYVGDEAKQKEIVFDTKVGDSEEIKAGLSSQPLTGDDATGSFYGSYTLPVDYNAEILRVALDASQMMGKVRTVPVSAITSYWPSTTDELAFTKLTNQNTDKTEDTITFAQQTLTTEIYAAYLAFSEEFDEDSLIGLASFIRDMFGEAWGKKFDTLALSDATYGAMSTTGILEAVMGAGQIDFDDITITDATNMVGELNSQAKRAGAEFYMHITSFDGLENEVDSNGTYRLRQPADGAPYRIKGHTVVNTDGMPSTSAASTSFAALGNPKYILHGERVGFEFRVYDQTQSNMEAGQIFLRCRTRHAFTLTIPTAWVKLTTAAA